MCQKQLEPKTPGCKLYVKRFSVATAFFKHGHMKQWWRRAPNYFITVSNDLDKENL